MMPGEMANGDRLIAPDGGGNAAPDLHSYFLSLERKTVMQWMADNFMYIMVGGVVIVAALVGLLLFLRNKGED